MSVLPRISDREASIKVHVLLSHEVPKGWRMNWMEGSDGDDPSAQDAGLSQATWSASAFSLLQSGWDAGWTLPCLVCRHFLSDSVGPPSVPRGSEREGRYRRDILRTPEHSSPLRYRESKLYEKHEAFPPHSDFRYRVDPL